MPVKNKSEKTNEVHNNCGMFNTCEIGVEEEHEGHPLKYHALQEQGLKKDN